MKSSLLTISVLLLFNQIYCQISINDSLELYYPFNEIYTKYVPDESGNLNRGIAFDIEPVEDRFGTQDKALYFRGDSYVRFEADSFNFLEYTYAAWVKLEDQPPFSTAYFVFNIGSDYAVDQHIAYTNNYSFYNLYGFMGQGYNTDGSASWISQNQQMEINSWNFVVYTRDSKISKLYVNGVLIDSTDVEGLLPIYGNSAKGIVGGRNNNDQHTKGYIDDVRVYSYAIDKHVVAELYLLDPSDIDTSSSYHGILVFPNPAVNKLHIDLPHNLSDYRILMYDSYGRFIAKFYNTNDLSVYHLKSGLYFLKVIDESAGYEATTKFIKY